MNLHNKMYKRNLGTGGIRIIKNHSIIKDLYSVFDLNGRCRIAKVNEITLLQEIKEGRFEWVKTTIWI